MNTEYESTLRHVLQFLFAQLAAYGYVDSSQTALYAGLAFSILTGVWGIVRARRTRKTAEAAIEVAKDAITSPTAVTPESAPYVVARKIEEKILQNGKH